MDINIPTKSMKAVMLLFTRRDARDSEKFYYSEVTNVNVIVEAGGKSHCYTYQEWNDKDFLAISCKQDVDYVLKNVT